jgi:hypothetical protein
MTMFIGRTTPSCSAGATQEDELQATVRNGRKKRVFLPLYEAKMVQAYDHPCRRRGR